MMTARHPGSAQDYLGAFERIADALPGCRLDWLRQARQAAIERFVRNGFPTRRDEDWKYTSVEPIEKGRFSVLPSPCPDFLAAEVGIHALPDAHLLVFVNGRLEPGLSRPGHLPAGTLLSGLDYLLETHPEAIGPALPGGAEGSPFGDLNLAFAADGAFLRLPPGAAVKAPIQFLFLVDEANLAIQPRNLIFASEGSSASIVEQHVALGDAAPYFTNAVTDIVLGCGAGIEHCKLQQESRQAFHIATVNVAQEAESRFASTSFALGAQLSRVGIAVDLRAEGASCSLDGLYLADGRQHMDHHTAVDHRAPRCTSREFYKGVLGGASRAVFNGRVVVHPDAQGSDAQQNNRNLLLSENAEIDTKPQLEIWADDVKCGHGATVGQLDENQVFYLRSRGVDEAAARAMLTRAFAMEIVGRVGQPSVQERLDALIRERLPGPNGGR